MHKLITSLLILFASINVFSQDEYFKLPNAKTQKPCLIFNKKIIGNEYLMKSFGTSEEEVKEKVKEIAVLKGKGNRKENDYYNLTDYGLVFLDLKESPESKTQTEFKEFFGLDKQNEIYIDGYLLESKKYRIALTGITEIEIVEPDNANGLKSKALNIWTLAKSERYRENAN
ncbi:hypothetical protein FEE95_01070 [Maribacter algarum]|uniref:Uncharacterized protein n=1 Tax=Maribacter algarum (ex Zhang et al. 2020) TaxID=2578118 RepID=A0A5S3PT28_9FLAO|nr:hypothetical protein [Maribacter algarum]TMM58048.1 hypothetical protein FEE95_01070 [Maribacter algarum]